jgi:DNA-binding MarR family transcriptional regulator
MPSVLVDLELGRNAYGRLLRDEMAEVGVDPREAVILRLLAMNGEVTVGDIRTSTGMPASTVTSVAKRLVADGLVARFRMTSDRRRVWLELTRLGRLAARMTGTAIDEVDERIRRSPGQDADSLTGVAGALHELTNPQWVSPLL